jgi:hypothetical protein
MTDPVIYREEVLTMMVVVGDIRREVERIRWLLDDEDDEEETQEDS